MTKREEFLNTIYVLDTETTDKDHAVCEVIEYGFALYDSVDKKDWEQDSVLYRPENPITPMISSITNITNKMVSNSESFMDSVPLWEEHFNISGRTIALAHNSFYDRKVLERHGLIFPKWLCTLIIGRKLWANDTSVENLTLSYLRYRFDVELPSHLANHRAGTDCYITGKILETQLTQLEDLGVIDVNEDYLPQIENWLTEPVVLEFVPFGKHKGKKFNEVPTSYWEWAICNMSCFDEGSEEYDANLAQTVVKLFE